MSEEELLLPPPPSAGDKPSTALLPPLGEELETALPKPKPLLAFRGDKPVASWGEVGLVLFTGFLGNIALRSTIGGLAASLACALAIVLVARRVTQASGFVPLGLALGLTPWLMVRSSVALTAVTFLLIAALLMLGGGFSIRGALFNSHVRQFVAHIGSTIYEWAYGTAMIQRLMKTATAEQRLMPLVRGVAVAVPVLIVFTTLLASADELFAQLLLLDNIPQLIGHLIVTLIVGIAILGLLSRAAHETEISSDKLMNIRLLGPIEIVTILGSLVLLFSAFVITQVVVALGGVNHVLETEGLTQASHARQGFFQLLWVAGLAIALVGGLRAFRVVDPEKGTDRFKPLAMVTLGLTFIIAVISIQRLSLYIDSFGLSPLRLWAMFGAGTVALAVVLFAVSIAGWRDGQSWFPGAMVILTAALVFGLNATNPDALVAQYNLSTQENVDIRSLGDLSDDAVPAMLKYADGSPALQQELCGRADRSTGYGFLEYNWAEVQADNKLDAYCGERVDRGGFWDEFAD